MKREFTKLMAALALLVFMTPTMAGWGQTDYSTTYTSNVTLSSTNGSNASTAKVRLSSTGTQYDAIKLGTSSKAGYAYITVPANTTTLHIHCAGWNGDGNSRKLNLTTDASGVTITPTNMSLTNDSGIANSSPFTLGTPANASTSYYKSFTLTGVTQETTIKLATSSKRAVYWGVNVEVVTTPSCSVNPSSYDFGDVQVNSNAQTKQFTVTASNLTAGLNFGLQNNEYYYISNGVYGMSATETSKTIVVTLNPTAVGEINDVLVISGTDFSGNNAIQVPLTANVFCNAPSTALAYTTPLNLTLTGNDVEYTLAPQTGTGNGGDITYEVTQGDSNHGILVNNVFTADAAGTWVVTATQDVEGSICGGTFDITINVLGTDPICTINPTVWDFGSVGIGSTAEKTFTITTANLTGSVTLAMDNDAYTVNPTSIAQNATSTEVTISFNPTSAGTIDAYLTANGGGISDDELALVSGTGATMYTITFDAGSGTCTTANMSGVSNASITLPTATPSEACADAGWTFAGWATSNTDFTTTAPTLLTGSYTITGDATLYAVYSQPIYNTTTFNVASHAAANNWTSGIAYTSVFINPITFTASGGGNNGKYYDSNETWRMYSGGSLSITSNTGTITAVTSDPSTTFTLNNDGSASQSFSAKVEFKSISVTTRTTTSNYATSPRVIAAPTFAPNVTTFEYDLEVTINHEAGTTVYYNINSSDNPTTNSTLYEGPFTIDATSNIKAIAIDGDYVSSVGSATFTREITDIIDVYAYSPFTVKGTVVAVNSRGFMLADATDNVYVYLYDQTNNPTPAIPAVGTMHKISGTPTKYGKVMEYDYTATISAATTSNYAGRTAYFIDGDDMNELINSTYYYSSAFEQFTGTLTRELVDQVYEYYVSVAGNTNNATVRIAYPTEAQTAVLDNLLNKTVSVEGYFTGVRTNPDYYTVTLGAIQEAASYTKPIIGYGDTEGGYYLIASPVAVIPVVAGMITDDGTNPENRLYDLYYFDQSEENEWQNYRAQTFILEPGKGYLYANKQNLVDNNSLSFTGAPYSGDGIIKLDYDENAEFAGWNLIGNPFASTATLNMAFYSMNTDGNGFVSATEGSEVAAMEGVFVQATAVNQTATFAAQSDKGAKKSIAKVELMLNGNKGIIDNAIVRFDDGQTLEKFMLNANGTKLYFTENNKDYAIVRSNAEGEMPVSFKASANGTYTLSVNPENVEMNYLHLIDNMTGADVDLLATPSYSFEAKTTDYASRFRLVFNANNGSNENGNETFAYYNGSEWVISNPSTGSGDNATLQVIDVMGRVLSSETVSGNATINLNQMPGVYMLRLVNGDSVKVQKVVVR